MRYSNRLPRSLMMTFTDRRQWDGLLTDALATPIAARYHEALPEQSSGRRVELRLTFDGDPNRIWAACPAEDHPQFLRVAARISLAVQESLRAWLPFVWFSNPGRFSDTETAAGMRVYGLARAVAQGAKQGFSFDVLDDGTPRAILHSVRKPLRVRLAALERALERVSGATAAYCYAPERVEGLLAFYRRSMHNVNQILVAERDLVEQYIHRGDQMAHPRALERGQAIIERRLRRLYQSQDFTALEPLLELEATAAAAAATGQAGRLCLEIRAIKPENFAQSEPLHWHEALPAFPPALGLDASAQAG